MELIYTDAAHNPQGIVQGFTLDMAFGSDENDFQLTVPATERLEVGSYVYEYGTERGGVIDTEEYDSTGDVPVLSYYGRTWHGIMDKSVVKPSGDYLKLSGDVYSVFGQLINRQGLQGVLKAPDGSSGLTLSNYQLPRYITLYEAVVRIAAFFGKRVSISKKGEACEVGVAEVEYHVGGSGEDIPLTITNNYRQVNHLVLLGKGELSARLVRDVYADGNGNVSTRQTFFGVDEVAEVYETSTQDDAAKLVEDGLEKLKDYQDPSEVIVNVPQGERFNVGDIVTGVAPEIGLSAQAQIIKQIVSVDRDGLETVSCSVGEPTFTNNM